jgi:hypothetical protein
MWSGCKDSQTSADANEAGKATGAMSYAFIRALSAYSLCCYSSPTNSDTTIVGIDQNPQQSYLQLLNSIR